jgi:hypothetical protein
VKIDRRGNIDCRLLKSHDRRMTDRAGTLRVDILMTVRQQIGRRCDSQQRDGCQRQDKYEFLPATLHFGASLHL